MALVRKIEQIVRSCFSKIWNRQFLIFLFFLVLSSAFWLFQTVNETYEEDFYVPVELKNVPGNVVITTELPEKLHLRLRDRGVTLLNYIYGQSFPPVVIDYNSYANASGHVRFLTADVVKQVTGRLAPSTQVVAMKPDTLEFYYNYGLCKRVPVRLQGTFRAADTYYVSDRILSADSVTVYAAKSLLDTITAAYTRPLYLKDIADTMRVRADFQSVRGVKFTPDHATLTLSVDRVVAKTVQVPVQWVNFPATKVLRTFPAKVSVTFQVGMARYRQITSESFVLVVNYEELLAAKDNKCHLALKTIPDGVSHVRISPQDVEYVIEEIPEQ